MDEPKNREGQRGEWQRGIIINHTIERITMEDIVDMQGKVKRTLKLDALLERIMIGYVRYEIWGMQSDELSWGSVNDRPIDMGRKKMMLESLKKEGLQQARSDTVIKMLLRRSWFENNVITSLGGVGIKDVPLLVLTEAGKVAVQGNELKPLEGLGRRGGVELWMKELKEKLTGVNGKMKMISELKKKTAGHIEERASMEEQKNEIEEEIERAHWWTYQILDQGEGHSHTIKE